MGTVIKSESHNLRLLSYKPLWKRVSLLKACHILLYEAGFIASVKFAFRSICMRCINNKKHWILGES